MRKNLLYIFIIFAAAMFALQGCDPPSSNKENKEATQNSEEQLTPDVQTTPQQRYVTDSTNIYGTGFFDYRDTLESYHIGYSKPRDSVYKVYNTRAFEKNELVNQDTISPEASLDRGNHFQNIKMYIEAIKDYDLYIRHNPYNHSAYMNRGNAHERLLRFDLAMKDYNMVTYLKPNDTIAYFNKGIIYDNLGQFDLAVKEYDTTLMKDPRLAKGYYNRGASYARLGNNDAARRDWEMAIKLNPLYGAELRPRINAFR